MTLSIPYLEISFRYSVSTDLYGNIHTNIKPDHVEEVLSHWLYNQMGKGKDDSKHFERDIYHMRIGMDLRDDIFYTESDTGNKSLTTGIVVNFAKFISGLSDLEKQVFLH